MPVLAIAIAALLLGIAYAGWRMHRRLETARAEADLYRDLFNNSGDAIFLCDPASGRLLHANRPFSKLYGSPGEAAPLSLDAIGSGEAPFSRAELARRVEAAGRDGAQLFEWRVRRHDGETVWVEVSLSCATAGRQGPILGTLRDISSRKQAEAHARALEARLAQLVENIPVPVFAIDENHRVTHWNRACEIVFGMPAAAVVGTDSPWRAFYPTARPVMADVVLDGLDGDRLERFYADKYHPSRFIPNCYEAEDFFPQFGNAGVWLSFTAAPLRDGDGRPIGAIETLLDISEQKIGQVALRSSERRFRTLVEHAPDAILVLDVASGRLIDANPRAEALFDLPGEALRGSDLLGLLAPGEPADTAGARTAPWHDALQRAIAGEAPSFEWRFTDRAGRAADWEVRWVRLPDEQGRTLLRGSVADVTERRRTEAALIEERNFLNSLLEAIPLPVFYKDRAGIYLGCNEAFLDGTGRRRDEVIGKSVFDMAPIEIARRYQEMDDALFAAPGRQVYEWLIKRPSGEERKVVFNKATFAHRDGEIAGLIGVILDVTELKQTQQRLEELNRELEQRVELRTGELRSAMRQLVQSEKLAALGHLVAGVAHELNTPIGTMLTLASAFEERLKAFSRDLEAGGLTRSAATGNLASMVEATEVLQRNAHRAAELVASFKQVAVDQASTRRRSFDLAQTVGEVLQTLAPLLRRKGGVAVSVDIPPGIVLDSFPGPLEQILTNLFTNSLAHGFEAQPGGRIEITADPRQDDVVLHYADDGKGIDAALLDRIFDPFFTTKLGQGGSGLGLYIVYSLVTGGLGGTLKVDSAPGAGARFELVLPLSAPEPRHADGVAPDRGAAAAAHNYVI